jgi:hypothetical protein
MRYPSLIAPVALAAAFAIGPPSAQALDDPSSKYPD